MKRDQFKRSRSNLGVEDNDLYDTAEWRQRTNKQVLVVKSVTPND